MFSDFYPYVEHLAKQQGVKVLFRDPYTNITIQNKPVMVNFDKYMKKHIEQQTDPYGLEKDLVPMY